MNEFKRKEPYYNIKIEGDYSNWSLAGFPGTGELHNNIKTYCECEETDGVTVQYTVAENISGTDIRLTHVSSALVNGIGEYSRDDYTVYICSSTWQGEAQWNEYSLKQLGIYRASNHVNVSAAKLSFNGSQTTSEHYPLIFIRNKKTNKIWFFEIEPLSGWYFEIGVMENMLYVEMNSAYMCNDGWNIVLKPNEKYISSKAFFGHTDGNFEDAVRILNKFKRKNAENRLKTPPVIFNDYMNCLWAKPTKEKLLPLIDAAAQAGCEIFCIDDGWYETGDGGEHLGDWVSNDKLFGPSGFSGVIEYIKDKNMLPGVWLEMESCSSTSNVYQTLNDCLLRRNGVIIGGSRAFLDFRREEVRNYTMDAVDRLYTMGVRYIKNDYNHNLCIGCDGADSLSQGLAEHRTSFLSFIEQVRKKYPDMIIESCSSGAMRADYGFIKHMDLQSVSDHEIYYNNPSIAAGTLACMLPEKCGFWAYPYPLKYENQPKESDWSSLNIQSNAEETVFNLINSMLGVMYLSGHIEMCDTDNMNLIKEGIEVYKQYRNEIPESEPVFITRPLKIYESGVMALGLKTSIGTVTAVWKVNEDNDKISIDIPEKLGNSAEILYPKSIKTNYSFEDNRLEMTVSEKYAARLFLIK